MVRSENMTFLALFLLAGASLCSAQLACDSAGRFPNIEYLGAGYDLVLGNPQPWDGFDPGWKAVNVIDMMDTSLNQMYDSCLVPNSATVRPTGVCSYVAKYSFVSDSYGYQQSLSVDVTFEEQARIDFVKERFSGSADYQESKQQTQSFSSVMSTATATCESYIAQVHQFMSINVTREFAAAVASMPTVLTNSTASQVQKLVAYFGTHYTTFINMGGKASRLMKSERSAYNSMAANGIDVQASAQVDFVVGTAGADAHVQKNYQDYEAFNSTMSMYQMVCIGAGGQCPPTSPDLQSNAWQMEVSKSPVPMKYTLDSLDSLLTSAFFPNDPQIALKQNVLYAFLQNYCDHMPNCVPSDTQGVWVNAANGPATKDATFVARPDGLLMTLGGVGTSCEELYSRVDLFNPDTNSWSAGVDFPFPIDGLRAAYIGSRLWAVGGVYGDCQNYNYLQNLYTFDSLGVWSKSVAAPPRNSHAWLATADNRLLMLGGSGTDASDLLAIRLFDPQTMSWTNQTNLPMACLPCSATLLGDGRVFLTSGQWASIFDLHKQSFLAIALTDTLKTVSVAAVGQMVFVAGQTAIKDLLHVSMYNVTADAWVLQPSPALMQVSLVASPGGRLWMSASNCAAADACSNSTLLTLQVPYVA